MPLERSESNFEIVFKHIEQLVLVDGPTVRQRQDYYFPKSDAIL